MSEATAEDLKLLPDVPIESEMRVVGLDELPEDERLVGPAPRPEFVENVRRVGVIMPLLLRDTGRKGRLRYHVLAGRRRIKAARVVGIEGLKALVVAGDEEPGADQLSALDAALNNLADANRASEFLQIEKLAASGYTDRQIGLAIGLDAGQLKARLKLFNLIPELRAAFLSGRMLPSNAEAAARLKEPAQRRLLVPLNENGKVTGPDIKEVKKARQKSAVSATLSGMDLSSMPGADAVTQTNQKVDSERRALVLSGVSCLRAYFEDGTISFDDDATREAAFAVLEAAEREVSRG